MESNIKTLENNKNRRKKMYNNIKTKRILAKNILASNDTWATGINNNDLLVGPAGSGKTRG